MFCEEIKMTVKKKPKKKPVPGVAAIGKTAIAEEKIEDISRADLKKMVAKVAESKSSYREIADEMYKQVKMDKPITQPTIGKYLEEEWGKDFKKKKEDMAERRSKVKKWNKNFELVRLNVGKKFHKEYISSMDGMMYNREKNILESIPVGMTDTQWKLRKRDIINFSKERMFGYTPDMKDFNKLGVYDPSVTSIIKRQLRRRIFGLAQDEYKRLEKKTFDDEMETRDQSGMDLEEKDAFQKKVMREVRRDLKPERAKIDEKAEENFKGVVDTLQREGIDNRSATLLGRDMLERKLCPAFSSSDKKYRGKQRMFAKKGIDPETGKPYVFSEAVYNIPEVLWSHPKRLQVMSHNLSKRLPELLHGEDPIIKGKESSIKGVNLRVRLPRNPKEDILTREAGIIITEDVARKFRYFNVVEKGHIIAESVDQLPQTWRVNKPPGTTNPIETHIDFKARVAEALEIQRGDPLTFSSFKDLDGNPGYKEAKHSGQLIYLGRPREKERSLTVDKDKDPQERSKINVNFITQEYIIVREDDIKRGDKIISRNGLKGVISEIVSDLGKDGKKRPYEVVVNLEEVWREADLKDPEYKIKDDTFFKQGKKKSGVVKEHEASDGQIFFFLIDKMAQDQSTSGLRMSTTMLSGLWEWFLYDVMGEGKRYTQAELDSKLEEFVGRYFGERGTFVPSLKAMHYKAVKKGDKIRIEIDEREPLPDRDGEVIYLPHTYAGRTYEYAYIPNFISRIYFDGSTLREYYQIDSSRKGTTSASGYYYQFIVRQIKNRTYIFPRNEDAVNLVAVPYYGNKPEDYDTVIMDLMDFINAGGNPYDKNPTVTFRKEPVTGKESIQTHPVKIDKTGKFNGCLAIHPSVALKATVDYDGDQVVVFTPAIDHARVKLTDDELKELVDLKKKVYTDRFSDYYKKAEKVKYAKTEEELGVRSAQYNQETGEIENTKIQQLGGLRKRSLVFYGSKLPEPVKYGSKKDPREKPLTPEWVNHVCDVEKILKMREPRWLVRELEKTDWDDLTKKQKDLVEDYHIRRELGRRLQKLVDSEKLERLMKIIQNEKSFIEDNRLIDRGTDPKGLEIRLGNRLVDRVIWQQLRGSDILTEEN